MNLRTIEPTGVEQTMSDTGTQAPPRTSEFSGAQPSPTPDEIRAQQAAITGQPVTMQPPASTPTWTDEMVNAERERVRQEEAAKLRPQLEGVASIRADLDAIRKEREGERAEAQRLVDEANAKTEAERVEKMTLTQKLDHHTAEMDERFRRLEESRLATEALLEKERQYNAAEEYRTAQLTQHGDNIMPQLRDLVAHGDQAAIDASITDLINRSSSVVEDLRQTQQRQWQGQQGVQATGAPVVGPLENQPGDRQYTAQDIANMSMADYARQRGTLLTASGNQFRANTRRG